MIMSGQPVSAGGPFSGFVDALMDDKMQETIRALVGGLAHEIKTPLSTIGMNLQLMRESLQAAPQRTPLEEKSLRKILLVEKEVLRLGDTLNEFLRFIGTKGAEKRPGSINLLVAELLDFLEQECRAKKIAIHRQLDYRIPLFHFDFEQVRQAVLNVLKNGVEAMEKEGGDLWVETSQRGSEAWITVTNTGRPIPREEREKIFGLYYSTKAKGSGLGLPSAARAFEQHGGGIELDEEPSWGVRFVLRLPMGDANRPSGDARDKGKLYGG